MPFRIFTPTRTAIPLLVSMMLASGVANTLLTKYQDQQCLDNCNNPDPKKRQHFEQPVIQTAQMFAGEMGCWLVVGATALHDRWGNGKTPSRHGYMPLDRESDHDGDANAVAPPLLNPSSPLMSNANPKAAFLDGWRVCLLALPAVCDICGTTLMNAGLLLVPASVYQMTRGALVLFVGAFSVMFLHRKLRLFQWISLGGVVLGVAIVGLAGAMYTDGNQVKASSADMSDPVRAIIGVLFVAFAQVFTASQFVLEEWIFEMSDVEPLNAVGWEGIFGFLATFASMILLHLSVGSKESGRHGYFDISHGLHQVVSNPAIFVSSILIMISIGCFNFFGLSVTRSVSATSRSTIDTCRTLFIWMISLGLGWETFKWLQVIGFALLVYFTFLYNEIIQPPLAWLRVEEVTTSPSNGEPRDHN